MKRFIFTFITLISFCNCKAQQFINLGGLKYIGVAYTETKNKSFINKQNIFIKGNDTVILNQKIPFDLQSHNIYNPGIFYNCKLEKDTLYTFKLKRITSTSIPMSFNSYYFINTKFQKKNNTFKEFKKDTPYHYEGITGMYVDCKNELFEIIEMTPLIGCVMQH